MKNKTLISIVVIIFVLGFGMIVLRKEPLLIPPPAQQSIVTNLSTIPDTKSMVKLVKNSHGERDLQERGPFTVFVPTDDAFAKLPANTLTDLEKEENLLKAMRMEHNHMILGSISSSQFKDGMILTTINAEALTLRQKNGKWYINDNIMITAIDIPSKNGVIHTIDTVLVPNNL